jgi:hypothetical protein
MVPACHVNGAAEIFDPHGTGAGRRYLTASQYDCTEKR